MAFHKTCYVVPTPVSHHYDLSYTSTAIPITHTISRPIFITGIYYTPWRPPIQLMILTFITLRLFCAFTAFRLHDFTAISHFHFSHYACYAPSQPFTFTTFTATTTTFDLIHPASPFPILFPYTLLLASTLGTLQGSDQLLVVSATSPEDQRTDSTRYQRINYYRFNKISGDQLQIIRQGQDWVMGWIYFLGIYLISLDIWYGRREMGYSGSQFYVFSFCVEFYTVIALVSCQMYEMRP